MYSADNVDRQYCRGHWENGVRAWVPWQHRTVPYKPYRDTGKFAPVTRTIGFGQPAVQQTPAYSTTAALDLRNRRAQNENTRQERNATADAAKYKRQSRLIPYEPYISEHMREFQPAFSEEYQQFTPTKAMDAYNAEQLAIRRANAANVFHRARSQYRPLTSTAAYGRTDPRANVSLAHSQQLEGRF